MELPGRHLGISLVLERFDQIQIRVAANNTSEHALGAIGRAFYDSLNRRAVESFGAQGDVDGRILFDSNNGLRSLPFSPTWIPE